MLILVCVCIGLLGYAQLEKPDSVWLSGIQSEGGEYRLNEETLDAIRSGRFFISDQFDGRMVRPDNSSQFFRGDSLMHRLEIYHVSPQEALLYMNTPDSLWIVRSGVMNGVHDMLINEYVRIPHSNLEIMKSGDDTFFPTTQEMRDDWIDRVYPRTYATFSLEDGLEDIFEPSERHKRENRKNANAWKYYNLEPMDE